MWYIYVYFSTILQLVFLCEEVLSYFALQIYAPLFCYKCSNKRAADCLIVSVSIGHTITLLFVLTFPLAAVEQLIGTNQLEFPQRPPGAPLGSYLTPSSEHDYTNRRSLFYFPLQQNCCSLSSPCKFIYPGFLWKYNKVLYFNTRMLNKTNQ